MRRFFVYILTNERHTVLYIGSTVDLAERVREHREKTRGSFTERYNVFKLVYYDEFSKLDEARDAERRIKGWTRRKKIALINSVNPEWRDMSKDL